jgi:hypothetical protein
MTQTEMFSEQEMGLGKDPNNLTDEAMISILLTRAHWTTKEPWTQIARRLQELSEESKKIKRL